MFDNIGKKIKIFAQAIAWIGIALSVVFGLASGAGSSGLGFLLITPIGCLLSWLLSLVLYGFGELIDCAQRIADKVNPLPKEIHHDGWTCPHCGEKNLLGDPKCKNCGRS